MRRCPTCRAENEDDADFCDQCSAALQGVPATVPGDGCCPDCGGEVAEAPGGKGVCKDCGAELAEKGSSAGEEAEGSESPAEKLSRLIKEGLASGLALDAAIDTGCGRYFASPDQPEKTAAAGGSECPVCGEPNPREALQCGSCAILFETATLPASCPVCSERSAADRCSCGAVLTLPKLCELADDSVRFLCPHCKSLFTSPRTECGDCGNSPLLPADRLRDYSRRLRKRS